MKNSTAFAEEEYITEVGVPYPNLTGEQSGEHKIGSAADVERRIAEAYQKMQETGDPYDPICQVYTYLLGYRDALNGRIPNVPRQ